MKNNFDLSRTCGRAFVLFLMSFAGAALATPTQHGAPGPQVPTSGAEASPENANYVRGIPALCAELDGAMAAECLRATEHRSFSGAAVALCKEITYSRGLDEKVREPLREVLLDCLKTAAEGSFSPAIKICQRAVHDAPNLLNACLVQVKDATFSAEAISTCRRFPNFSKANVTCIEILKNRNLQRFAGQLCLKHLDETAKNFELELECLRKVVDQSWTRTSHFFCNENARNSEEMNQCVDFMVANSKALGRRNYQRCDKPELKLSEKLKCLEAKP